MGNEVAGLIGHGQVGSSIARNYKHKEVPLRINDTPQGLTDNLEGCTLIHIAAPIEVIAEVMPSLEPLYLVHSTVPIGFCRKLYQGGYKVLHCPVEGRHPDISTALTYWQMPLGGPREYKERALLHLCTVDMMPDPEWGDWEETELAKLFSTTWMGIEVAIMREAYRLAAKFGVSGDQIYKAYTAKYNELYQHGGVGASDFQPCRPMLKPMEGPIGGHCVGPNAKILQNQLRTPSWMADMVAKIQDEHWRNPCV
jgi:hypothetical protein